MKRAALVLVALAAAPAPAGAAVRGISDNNLPLLTQHGRAVAAALPVAHGRLVIAYGTDQKATSVRLWMAAARGFGWDTTIAVSRNSGQPVPSPRAYSAWLSRLLHIYPQITAVEATNEPDITGISAARATALYRAAVRAAHGRAAVLAGGFSDRAGGQPYVREYARRLPGAAKLWAFHAYSSVVDNRLSYVRGLMRLSHAHSVWVTETAAFAALGRRTFTLAQYRRQVARVRRLSSWPIVHRTYWQGLESCRGCQPAVTLPLLTPGAPTAGPVLPYVQPASPIIWDSALLSSTPTATQARPGLSLFSKEPK